MNLNNIGTLKISLAILKEEIVDSKSGCSPSGRQAAAVALCSVRGDA
jgi:hypothetical protein